MKRNLLAVGIAAAGIMMSQYSLADASVYGQIDLSLQSLDETNKAGVTAKDNWELLSNSSRLGFKGDASINESLKVIYKLEYEVAPDEGAFSSTKSATLSNDEKVEIKVDNEFKSRNIYLGLQGDFGTLIAGKNDTPLKLAQNKIDQFNDLTYGDIKNIMVGENRLNDIIMYTTPEAGGLSASLAIAPGEDKGTGEDDDDGIADRVSAAIQYEAGDFYASLAHDNNVEATDITRVVFQYKIADLQLGALWQTAEKNEDADVVGKLDGIVSAAGFKFDEQDAYVLSAAYKLGDFTLKGQFGESTSENSVSAQEYDASMWALGVDYKLAKSTKVYTYYANLDGEADALTGEPEYKTFGVGIQHKF